MLLSSSTTFVGLLPMMFATSPQAQTLVPLVVAVGFGLLASTVLVVLVLPAAIAIFFDFIDIETWLANREQARPPEPRPAK